MDDLISRAAALDAIGKMIHEYREKGDYDLADALILTRRYVLKRLPAVSAVQVVRCGDCEHSYFASNRIPDEQCWVCGKHGIDVTTDWFCADGERRDSE